MTPWTDAARTHTRAFPAEDGTYFLTVLPLSSQTGEISITTNELCLRTITHTGDKTTAEMVY